MLFLLPWPIVIHAMTMMQQLALTEGFECSKISCATDCPSEFKRFKRLASSPEVFFHLQNSTFNTNSNDPHAKEFYSSQSKEARNNLNLMFCCGSMCRQSCILANGTIIADKSEWQNPENSCQTLVCGDGVISTHVSLCRPLSCDKADHVTEPGQCCPKCHESWANFCKNDDEDDDDVCDIACQFGYVRDEIRGCDECKCVRRKQTSSTTSEPTAFIDDATESVKYDFYFYPDQNIFIFISVALSVTLIACVVGVGLYFHRKVYKRIPPSTA